jgi:hypothetical protein
MGLTSRKRVKVHVNGNCILYLADGSSIEGDRQKARIRGALVASGE